MLSDKLAKEVEKQKLKAIGARNMLQSMAKEKEINSQQIQVIAYSIKLNVIS